MSSGWDSAKGVFVGERARSSTDLEIPQPLWVFGYASLVWRPETGWERFARARGSVQGWSRWFAQRSMDHRGTPEAPGLVCTLLPDNALEAMGARPPGGPPSRTIGAAYLVPDDCTDDVLASLDYREKGGYSREVACVTLEDGSEVRALVYSASIDNPNFVKELVSTEPGALDEAAAIIAASVGPSGANNEYLFRLADAVPDDAYLQALADRVRAQG